MEERLTAAAGEGGGRGEGEGGGGEAAGHGAPQSGVWMACFTDWTPCSTALPATSRSWVAR